MRLQSPHHPQLLQAGIEASTCRTFSLDTHTKGDDSNGEYWSICGQVKDTMWRQKSRLNTSVPEEINQWVSARQSCTFPSGVEWLNKKTVQHPIQNAFNLLSKPMTQTENCNCKIRNTPQRIASSFQTYLQQHMQICSSLYHKRFNRITASCNPQIVELSHQPMGFSGRITKKKKKPRRFKAHCSILSRSCRKRSQRLAGALPTSS